MKKSMVFLMVAVAFAAPALSQTRRAAAPARPTGPQPISRAVFLQNMDGDFAQMDANHDGKVTKAEITTALQQQEMQAIAARSRMLFNQLDANHDGKLSAQEFAQFHQAAGPVNSAAMLQKFDSNHDGIVTDVEFRTTTLANFDRLDTNKDGVVDAAELKAAALAQASANPQPIPRTTYLQNMNASFAQMDSNHDGKATKTEIEAYLRAKEIQGIAARNHALFTELDANHDGFLSPQEFAQFHPAAAPVDARATGMLQKFDTNHDGAVTQVEWRAATLANFDRLDTNKDGVVDAAEMKAGGIVK